jgi:hypothetical protein
VFELRRVDARRCRYWQRKRAAAREQLQQLRLEHEAHVREQREKEEAEKLLNRVSEGVRAGADAKQRKEIKRALSAREKERELARKQLERYRNSIRTLEQSRAALFFLGFSRAFLPWFFHSLLANYFQGTGDAR